MSHKPYKWKRFWCPRSGSINLADGGYLYDPEATYGSAYNPDLVTFDTLLSFPCVALLGEPGIGKTQALEAERAELVSKISEQGNQALFLDLRSYGDEGRLVQKLFKSPEFVAWQGGTHQLHIFLDSLDECLLRIDTLAALLIDEFRPYQDRVERLCLRIACRTAVWPSVLEEGLKALWGKEAVEVYELAPLRYVDVEEAAKDEGFLADNFLKEVGQKNIVPLAIKPVTLGFLLNTYRRHNNQFPENQGLCDLYLEGCRLLCEEVNESRRSSKQKGKLDADQRLVVAARIAAVTIFANKFAVWTGVDRGDVPNEDVLLSKLCHGSESANGRRFDITQEVVEEVLDTGLFSSRGLGQMGWAHQTYAEFLAAWYLKQHNLSLEQVLSLIIHPDGRIIPQLQETVAWLANMMPEVFQEVMKTDPDILLQSDVASRTEKDKVNLIYSLLRAYDEGHLPHRFNQYKHLNHTEIGTQLRSYICDSEKGESSRLVAIDIARACGVSEMQQDLINVAVSPTQSYWVRVNSVITIRDIGDDKIKEKLRPLVFGQTENDPEDYLKGYSLEAIYPKYLTADELLSNISQPKSNSLGGAYSKFLAEKLVERLPLSDLPIFLGWFERQPVRRHELHYPFKQLTDSVMLKAWQNLNQPGVLGAFAKVATLKLKHYEGILSDLPSRIYTAASFDCNRDADIESFLGDSDEKRRQLIETIVLSLAESENDFSWLVGIIYSQDILWLIENAVSSKFTEIWVGLLSKALISHNLRWRNVQINDAILQACSISPQLQSEFEFDITPIELNSAKATQLKAEYLEYQNRWEPPKPKALLDPPPSQRVLTILQKVELGHPELWWQVVMAMTLTLTSIHWDNAAAFEPDLTKLFGWSDADADTKLRIVKAAKKYLDIVELEISELLKPKNLSNDNFAIYQALYLLEKQETDFSSTISRETWGKLTPIMLKALNFSFEARRERDECCQRIVRAAYKNNIDIFIGVLAALMCQMNYQPLTRYMDDIYRFTSDLLNEHISMLILRRVDSHDLRAGMLEVLLADFFDQDIDKAKDFAISLISFPIPRTGDARAKAIVAARMLFIHADNSSWLVLWSAMQQDLEFGREVLEAIASESLCTGKIELQLKEKYLADLYIFLVDQYPENASSRPSTKELSGIKAQILPESDSVRMWKSYIPQRIQVRGTQEAYDALQKIIREIPTQKEKLQPLLLECEGQVRRSTWRWKTPEEFLQLVLEEEPSKLQLLKEIQKVANEPKIDKSIHIGERANISGYLNTGDGENQNKLDPPDAPKEINWGNWLALISLLVAIVALPIGIFNSEINQQIKQWFNQSSPAKIEPQSKPPSK